MSSSQSLLDSFARSLVSSRLFLGLPGSSSIFWALPSSSGLFQDLFGSSGLFVVSSSWALQCFSQSLPCSFKPLPDTSAMLQRTSWVFLHILFWALAGPCWALPCSLCALPDSSCDLPGFFLSFSWAPSVCWALPGFPLFFWPFLASSGLFLCSGGAFLDFPGIFLDFVPGSAWTLPDVSKTFPGSPRALARSSWLFLYC